jgi:probable rRNA maturation factor
MTSTSAAVTVEVAVELSAAVEAILLPEYLATEVAPIETWTEWFRVWLQTLAVNWSPIAAYELSLQLVSDAEIQALNADYRQRDQPTDVLAFAAMEVDAPMPEALRRSQPLYLGDIVISLETAQQQGQQQGHSLRQELGWLATHGLLHLLGWDHPDQVQLQAMLDQQATLLAEVGLWSIAR